MLRCTVKKKGLRPFTTKYTKEHKGTQRNTKKADILGKKENFVLITCTRSRAASSGASGVIQAVQG